MSDPIYPSLIFLPAAMVAAAFGHRVLWGPERVIRVSGEISEWLCGKMRHRAQPVEFDALKKQVFGIYAWMPHRYVACLEFAVALRCWLGFHGVASRVILGKRWDGRSFRVHAWLESEIGSFYKRDDFSVIFEDAV